MIKKISIVFIFILFLHNFLAAVTDTPTPPADWGRVRLDPLPLTVRTNMDFTLDVYVNTLNQLLGAYAFTITWNPDYLSVNTDQGLQNDGTQQPSTCRLF